MKKAVDRQEKLPVFLCSEVKEEGVLYIFRIF